MSANRFAYLDTKEDGQRVPRMRSMMGVEVEHRLKQASKLHKVTNTMREELQRLT